MKVERGPDTSPSGCLSMAHLPGVVSAGAEGYHLGLSCRSVRCGWLETNGTGTKRWRCAGLLVPSTARTGVSLSKRPPIRNPWILITYLITG